LRDGLGVSTRDFTAAKIDYVLRDQRNRTLDLTGERIVAAYERMTLTDAGIADLAEKVELVSETMGDGLGYDVRSFDYTSGEEKHIEVKTTSGPASMPFYMSRSEKEYAAQSKHPYFLYRIYGYDSTLPQISFFSLTADELSGGVDFQPIQFRVSVR
jgi:hypothetical protein